MSAVPFSGIFTSFLFNILRAGLRLPVDLHAVPHGQITPHLSALEGKLALGKYRTGQMHAC